MNKKPKVGKWKKHLKKGSLVPKKGYRWKDNTSGKIPEPAVERIPTAKKKPSRLKPMRTVASGTNAFGQPRTTIKNKSRSRSL